MIEVELYRQRANDACGRTIRSIEAGDTWFLKDGTTAEVLTKVLVGSQFSGTRRIGKLLLLDISNGQNPRMTQGPLITPGPLMMQGPNRGSRRPVGGSVLGLRFGMTGRLVVDGVAGIDELLYSSHRPDPAFTRFALTFEDGGRLEMSDPRRLGGVSLDPDVSGLGRDAAVVSVVDLGDIMAGSTAPLKARLLDQSRIAGVGNLIADETLWRARLSPIRLAGSLSLVENQMLHRALRKTIRELTQRGGSHTGDLMASRARGALCPRCGGSLNRETVGGRTTYWCPAEQT